MPQDLELIAQKCLAKEPTDRYPTAAALAEDLRRWLNGESVSVKAAGPVERTVKWVKRNKLAAGIMAVSVIGVAVASTFAAVAYVQSERAKLAVQRADQKTDDANREYLRAEDKANLAQAQTLRANESAIKAQEANAATALKAKEERRLLDIFRIREAKKAFDNNLVQQAHVMLNAVALENRTSAWHLARCICEGSQLTHYNTGLVVSVAWSPDGRTLASVAGGTVVFTDALTGNSSKFNGMSALRIAWNSDSTKLAVATQDRTVCIVDSQSRKLLRTLTGATNWVTCVAWNPNGALIAGGVHGGSDKDSGRIIIWNAHTGDVLHHINGMANSPTDIAWSPDGHHLATSAHSTPIHIIDAITGTTTKLMYPRQNTESKVIESPVFSSCVSWSPCGRYLSKAHGASNNKDGTLFIWDWQSGTIMKSIILNNIGINVECHGWNPDGRTLTCTGSENAIHLIDLVSNQSLRILKGHSSRVFQACWNPDGRILATGSADGTLRLWDITSPQNPQVLNGSTITHTKTYYSGTWTSDGKVLISSGAPKSTIRAISTESGKLLLEFNISGTRQDSIIHSPDGNKLIVIDEHLRRPGRLSTISLWDARTGKKEKVLACDTGGVNAMCWSKDGERIAAVSEDYVRMQSIRVWDARTGIVLKEQTLGRQKIDRIEWSPDAKLIALCSSGNSVRNDNMIAIMETETAQILRQIRGNILYVDSLTWLPGNRILATTGRFDGTIFWDTNNGECLGELQGYKTGSKTAVSSDGRTLAINGEECTLWDTQTYQMIMTLPCSGFVVEAVAWSSEGQKLATYCSDGFPRIWNCSANEMATILKAHSQNYHVTGIARSLDGRQLVSTAVRKVINAPRLLEENRVWDHQSASLLSNAAIPPLTNIDNDAYEYHFVENVIYRIPKRLSHESLASRSMLVAPKPDWHRKQAADCEKQSNWFAAAFHLRKLDALEPSPEMKARLAAVEKQLSRETARPTPDAIP